MRNPYGPGKIRDRLRPRSREPLRRRLLGTELRIALVVFAVGAALLFIISRPCYSDNGCNQFWSGVVVEAHGMLLDLLVIGFFVVWLNQRARRQHESIQFQEEIDSLRDSKTLDAGARILYLVRMLNRNKITSIFLAKAHFDGLDLRGDGEPWATKRTVDLAGSYAPYASFVGAIVSGVDFHGADLQGCNFEEAHCCRTDFRGAILFGANFRNTSLQFADFSGALHLLPAMLAAAKSLRGAVMNERLKSEVLALNPNAFDDEPMQSEIAPFLAQLNPHDIADQIVSLKRAHDEELRLAKMKSYGAHSLLCLLFGPLGLMYATGWRTGSSLTIAVLLLCLLQPSAAFDVLLSTWLMCFIVGIVAVRRHNVKIAQDA